MRDAMDASTKRIFDTLSSQQYARARLCRGLGHGTHQQRRDSALAILRNLDGDALGEAKGAGLVQGNHDPVHASID